MRSRGLAALAMICWVSCGPGPETAKPPVPVSAYAKEDIYKIGHQFNMEQKYDSAEVYLLKACSMDVSYLPPLAELAEMHYALAVREAGDTNPRRMDHFRKSFGYFERLEANGSRDSGVLERLCELSNTLGDDRAFVRYARKNAEIYPYERQYVNLGLALFQSGDYQGVIKLEKEAIEKFKSSSYVGGFYRQMGRAYMKVDRDQTAERTFDSGLNAVDAVVSARTRADTHFTSTEEYRRLVDDKTGMLISLRGLHQTYHATEKLQKVERQLRDLGYEK